MDSKDKKILEILQNDGRITNKSLSEMLDLSPPSALERVRKLEVKGIIKSYKAILDRIKINRPILAFIAISLDKNSKEVIRSTTEQFKQVKEILDIYRLTGRFDLLIKVTAISLDDLNDIISTKVSYIDTIQKVETFLVLEAHENKPFPLV